MSLLRRLLGSRDSVDLGGAGLAMKLTAAILILDQVPIWYVRPVLVIVGMLMLFFPIALRSRTLWAIVVLLTSFRVVRLWPVVDNHQYLMVYWSLGILIALMLARPREALATSARWLLAFVFLWATLWKAFLSPDYMDGRFYRVHLLTDARFADKTVLLGGLSQERYQRNRDLITGDSVAVADPSSQRIEEPPAFSRLASLLTWGTVLCEGLVALAFLLPWGRWTPLVRHGAILLFCSTAYLVAPVATFGWILLAMGLAQVPPGWRALQGAYIVAFFLVDLYQTLPWSAVFAHLGALPFF